MSSVVPASYRPLATCPSKARESAPAQKARPAPVTIIARTSGLPSASVSNQRYSVCMRPVQAFIRCGRLKVIVAIPSATAYCVTFSSIADNAGSIPATCLCFSPLALFPMTNGRGSYRLSSTYFTMRPAKSPCSRQRASRSKKASPPSG